MNPCRVTLELIWTNYTVWKKFFRSMWKDFNTKFGGILKSLGRHKSFVESCAHHAQFQLYQHDVVDMRAASLARFQEYQRDVNGMNAKLDELITEEQAKKKKAVIQWLGAGQQALQDHESYRQIRSDYSGTTHWVLKQAHVKDWLEPAIPSTPVLWMHGIPGAGKSFTLSTKRSHLTLNRQNDTRICYHRQMRSTARFHDSLLLLP